MLKNDAALINNKNPQWASENEEEKASNSQRKNGQRICTGNSQKKKPKGLTIIAMQRNPKENKRSFTSIETKTGVSIRKELRYRNPAHCW